MAKIEADVILQSQYTNDEGRTYYSVVDLDTGGMFSFNIDGDGVIEGAKDGLHLNIKADMKINRVSTKTGVKTFITLLDGVFQKA